MLLSIYQFSVIHVLESSVKCIARYWFMASSVQKSNNYMEVSFMNFHLTKNCYKWFPMISGHGTIKLLSMGFEILWLAID